MWKLALMLFAIAGTVLAGVCVIVVLNVPAWADQAMRYVPIAALVGFVIGIPVSWILARAIAGPGERIA